MFCDCLRLRSGADAQRTRSQHVAFAQRSYKYAKLSSRVGRELRLNNTIGNKIDFKEKTLLLPLLV